MLDVSTGLAVIMSHCLCRCSSPRTLACSLVHAIVLIWMTLNPVLASDWRTVDAGDLAVMTLDEGQVIIELNATFAPKHVAQFRALANAGFYDGLGFYRVIEGFVAQAGDGSDMSDAEPAAAAVPAEFVRPLKGLDGVTPVQSPDPFAPSTAFHRGFAIGSNPEEDTAWLLHCPGVVAMARGNAPDSGHADFYIVIGQAPRYLDRNLSVFGRVVHGMDVVQRIRRGPTSANGMIDQASAQTLIRQLRMMSALPPQEQRSVAVMDTATDGFADLLRQRRHRTHEFFVTTPPAVLDACQVPLMSRIGPAAAQAGIGSGDRP